MWNNEERESYVSAFCTTPRPDRFEEMTLIKKMIDDDKIELLKAVIAKVAAVSDTEERCPVFQKLAEKFGVWTSSEKKVEFKVEFNVEVKDPKSVNPSSVFQRKQNIVTNLRRHHLNNLIKKDPLELKPNMVINPDDSLAVKSQSSLHHNDSERELHLEFVKSEEEFKHYYTPESVSLLDPLASLSNTSSSSLPGYISNHEADSSSKFSTSIIRTPYTFDVPNSTCDMPHFTLTTPPPPSVVSDSDNESQLVLVIPATPLSLANTSREKTSEQMKLTKFNPSIRCDNRQKGREQWVVGKKSSEHSIVCKKSFGNSNAINNHKSQAHKILKDSKIAENNQKFDQADQSFVNDVNRKIFCTQCEIICKSKASLDKHTRRAHNVKSTVACPNNCGKMLTSRHAIKKHLLSHKPPSEWPVSCPLCRRRFQARADIPKHLLTARHRDEVPAVNTKEWWALVYHDKPELAMRRMY